MVMVSDIFEDQLKKVTDKHNTVKVVAPQNIFEVEADIYAPCALGATVNNASIEQMKFAIIAGAANNQLEKPDLHAKMLTDKGILYAPDFLINAGGLINVYSELNGYNRQNALSQTENIYNQTLAIFALADNDGITTSDAALKLAKKRIEDIRHIKTVL